MDIHLVRAAIRLQIDEMGGDMVHCCPSSLAMLLTYIVRKFPVAPKPFAQPYLWRFYLFRLRALLRSPLRGLPISPGLKLFHSPVNPLSRSLDRDFVRERRFPRLCPRSQDHEGISFSLPGMGPHSLLQWYNLLSSVSSRATSVPMSVGHAAIMEKTLRSALESYKFQFNDALFIISGDSGQIPLETVAFVATWSERCFLCHMTPPVSTGQKRDLLSDSVFRQVDLSAPASLDAAWHAARNVFFSWGSPSRLSTSPGTTRCCHFALSSASRGRTQSFTASAPPQISQSLFLDAFYAPQEVARSPKGVLRG